MNSAAEVIAELQMSKNTRPVLRAGKANILLAISCAGLFVVINLLLERSLGLRIAGALLALLLASAVLTYVRSISRIQFRSEAVVMQGPISDRVVRYEDVEQVHMSTSRLNPALRLDLKLRGGRKLRREILGESTAWGGLDETSARIKAEFERRGVGMAGV